MGERKGFGGATKRMEETQEQTSKYIRWRPVRTAEGLEIKGKYIPIKGTIVDILDLKEGKFGKQRPIVMDCGNGPKEFTVSAFLESLLEQAGCMVGDVVEIERYEVDGKSRFNVKKC